MPFPGLPPPLAGTAPPTQNWGGPQFSLLGAGIGSLLRACVWKNEPQRKEPYTNLGTHLEVKKTGPFLFRSWLGHRFQISSLYHLLAKVTQLSSWLREDPYPLGTRYRKGLCMLEQAVLGGELRNSSGLLPPIRFKWLLLQLAQHSLPQEPRTCHPLCLEHASSTYSLGSFPHCLQVTSWMSPHSEKSFCIK